MHAGDLDIAVTVLCSMYLLLRNPYVCEHHSEKSNSTDFIRHFSCLGVHALCVLSSRRFFVLVFSVADLQVYNVVLARLLQSLIVWLQGFVKPSDNHRSTNYLPVLVSSEGEDFALLLITLSFFLFYFVWVFTVMMNGLWIHDLQDRKLLTCSQRICDITLRSLVYLFPLSNVSFIAQTLPDNLWIKLALPILLTFCLEYQPKRNT